MTSTGSPENGNVPIRVVFDANVLISAALAGIQAEYALELVVEEWLTGYVSEPILGEVQHKLVEKFHRTVEETTTQLVRFRKFLKIVKPVTVRQSRLRDVGDLHVLGTAVAANADLIVTTDRDLLTLKRFGRIGIIHPKTLRWTFPS